MAKHEPTQDGPSAAERSRPSRIFRRASLERLNSPERLDELMGVIGPQSWIALGGLALVVAAGLAWAVLGRVPVTIEARGVLVHPRRVVDVQAPRDGTLGGLRLTPGATVAEGDVLATLDRPLLRHQLQLRREELELRRERLRVSAPLHARRVELERAALERERAALRRRIEESRAQADRILDANEETREERRRGIERQLELFRGLNERLQARVKDYTALEERGVINKHVVLQVEQALLNGLLTVQELEARLQALTVEAIGDQAEDLRRRHAIIELETQLQALDAREGRLTEETSRFAFEEEEPVRALEREVARLEEQLGQESLVRSPHAGRVIEVLAAAGQVVSPGDRLAVLEVQDVERPLVSLSCFALKDGKRAREGLTLQVSPENVERERYGAALGRVTRVAAFPSTLEEVSRLVGNEELARALVPAGGCIVVYGELTPDPAAPSGFAWSSSRGPDLRLTPGTPTRTRLVVEERSPLSFVLPGLDATRR